MSCHRLHFKAKVHNLVSNLSGAAAIVDARLQNAWGIVEYDNSLWVTANENGIILNYTLDGSILPTTPIVVPGGQPTGIVVNRFPGTTGINFPVTSGPNTEAATFLVATENGTVVAYNETVDPVNAIVVIDRSGVDAVYTGLAIANNRLFVADFANRRIDVFDANYNLLTGYVFLDQSDCKPLPADFSPFNIAAIDNRLYVTYARQSITDPADTVDAVGNGYINVFDIYGAFVRRFASQCALNSPWGIAVAPYCFGLECKIFVGNFGDGRINVYDFCGKFYGQLRDRCGEPIIINALSGLLALRNRLYFVAGPADVNGLLGYINEAKRCDRY